MFPSQFEETMNVKEFAGYLGTSYHLGRRLLIQYGGYQNVGTGTKNESRVVTKKRADEIKAQITVQGKKNGGRQ